MFPRNLQGCVDLVRPDVIQGWAIDRNTPQQPVYVDIFFDGMLFATVLACLYRDDLAKAGLGFGNCAFELAFPHRLFDGNERSIAVRFAQTEIPLPNSPQRVLFSLAEDKRPCGSPSPALLQQVKAAWATRLNEEARFWWQWLTTDEPSVVADRAHRIQPREPDAEMRELLDPPEGAALRFLDVGSGPLTVLPSVWPGRSVEIKAADALANHYTGMLEEAGIVPLAAPDFVEAEALGRVYAAGSFDFVECVNTLDRCADPLRALCEMIAVLRPGGVARIVSEMNLGQKTGYAGRQHWNLSLERGRPVIWSAQAYTDLLEYLADRVMLERAGVHGNMIRIVLRRT